MRASNWFLFCHTDQAHPRARTRTRSFTAFTSHTQIKRIHEYKRQYLNVLSIIYRYKQLKKMTPEERKKVGGDGT